MAVTAPGQLNVNEPPSWGSRSVDCFEKLEQIGEGTYGSAICAYTLLRLILLIRCVSYHLLGFENLSSRLISIIVSLFLFSYFLYLFTDIFIYAFRGWEFIGSSCVPEFEL